MKVYLFLIPFLLLACGGKAPNKAPVVTSDPTLHLSRNDEELDRIAEQARKTLPAFIRRLRRPRDGDGNFRIKCPFRADSGSGFSREQIWLSDIHFSNGAWFGTAANTPFYISGFKKGDTLSFSTDDITDWMYIHDGKIIGGLSIKYLLEQIPENERDKDQQAVRSLFP
ncbi:MAG: DUF2314 domain-containing protein [Treponema sp.]|nr:DUF2314 domain-containing protein [Treponema sp.]